MILDRYYIEGGKAVKNLLTDGDIKLRIKCSQGAPNMSARIPQLQKPYIDNIQTGTRDRPGGSAGSLH